MNPLGRRVPKDFDHVEKWPLTAATIPTPPTPVVLGVNWYDNFDEPVQDSKGYWWIGRGNLGSVRGGHCVCLEPGDRSSGTRLQDTPGWWEFYNQLREGACGGAGGSRMMSLLNRKRYDFRWLWNRAKEVDEWPDTNPGDNEGTSVRAVMDVLRTQGHLPWGRKIPQLSEGIAANRWARSVPQVMAALSSPASERMGAVRVLNSWGKAASDWHPGKPGYPHRVWMPFDVLQRLLDEDGEATLVVDR